MSDDQTNLKSRNEDPNLSADEIQQVGFPKEEYGDPKTSMMHQSQALLDTEKLKDDGTTSSAAASMERIELEVGKISVSKLTQSSDHTAKQIANKIHTMDQMKLDYQAAKSDTGEHIKSSRIFHDLLELMRQVELFKTQDNIRGHDLEDVIQVMSIEKFEKNDVVFEYGDIGDKFFIILSGEAAVQIPNDLIFDWKKGYADYKLLLEDIKQRKIIEQKNRLVEMRELELQGIKDNSLTPLPLDLKKSASITTPTLQRRQTSFASNLNTLSKPKRKKFAPSKSLMIQTPFEKSKTMISDEQSSDLSRNDMEGQDAFGAIREVDEETFFGGGNRMKTYSSNMSMCASQRGYGGNQEEMLNNRVETILADFQERIENFETVKEAENKGIITMDKLMKRIKRLDKQSDRINQPMFSGIRMDPQILKDQPVEDDGAGTDTSMLASLGKKRAVTKELYVQDLSDKQISRLTQRQINQIVKKEVKLSSILPVDEAYNLNREWLLEFKRLKKGEYFGELALASDKPNARAATIMCTKNCIFGVVKKVDYRRVVGKIHQRAKIKINSFLEQLPIFRNWTHKGLSNLQLFLEKVSFIRNQVIIKEDENPTHVYLVYEGDFAFTKKVPEVVEKKVKVDKLLGPQAFDHESVNYKEQRIVKDALGDLVPLNASKSQNSTTGSSLTKTRLQGNFKLAVFSKGQFFGEDDYLKCRKNLGTVTCLSGKATLFRMSTRIFQTKILNKVDESMKETIRSISDKEVLIHDRIKMIGNIYGITPADIREEAKLMDTQENFALNKSSSKTILQQSSRQLQSSAQLQAINRSDSVMNGSVNQSPSAINTVGTTLQDLVPDEYSSVQNESVIPTIRRDHSTPKITTFDSEENQPYRHQASTKTMNVQQKVIPPAVKVVYPPQIKTFRPINKTRKIHYPHMIKKYKIDKPQQMHIDDFRSAMRRIVKQPNQSGFMKMDENVSNFSSDDNKSHRDAKDMNFIDQPKGSISPSMLDLSTKTDRYDKKRYGGTSLPSTMKTSSIFTKRNSSMQAANDISSMIKISQSNFKSSNISPKQIVATPYSSFFAKKSVDQIGNEYMSTGSNRYKITPQKLTTDLMKRRNLQSTIVMQSAEESLIFNPQGSERNENQQYLHDANGPDAMIRNQYELNRQSNSVLSSPSPYLQNYNTSGHTLNSSLSMISQLLPPVAGSSSFKRKNSIPINIKPHNRFEGTIRQRFAERKSFLAVDQISKINLTRNVEELSSREVAYRDKQKQLMLIQQTQKEKEILNNSVTAQILCYQAVKYIGVAQTKRKNPANSGNVSRRTSSMIEKSRQTLIR